MAASDQRPARPQHLFIVSSSPYGKPDVATEYQRRAHAARHARRKGARAAKAIPNSNQTLDNNQNTSSVTQKSWGTGFLHIPNLDIELSSCLRQLVLVTVDLDRFHNRHCTKSTFSNFLEVRTRLEATFSQTAGLAFLKPKDLVYEACRFSAMIYCDLLARLPCVIDARLSLGVHLSYMQRSKVFRNDQDASHKFNRQPAYGLHYVLNSLFVDSCWDLYPGLMKWATILGAIGAIGTPDRKWYVKMVRARCETNSVSFIELKSMLGDYLWLDDVCNEEGKRLWEEAKNLTCE